MKNLFKFLVTGFGVLAMTAMAACGSSEDPQPDPDPDTPSENQSATINDAYAGNRPDYDGMFDYDSGYEPTEPPAVDTVVSVSIDADSGIKFADGTLTREILYGTELTAADFDVSGVPGKTLAGFGYLYEGDAYAEDIRTLGSNATVPGKAVTLIPCFTPVNGSVLTIGTANGNTPLVQFHGVGDNPTNRNDINGGFTREQNRVVGYTKGVALIYNTSMEEKEYFRLQTGYNIAANTTYTYTYTFENFGTDTLAFNLYQVIAYMETTADGVDSDQVVLEPGATQTVTLTVTYSASNTNALTVFHLTQATTDFNLGISMVIKEGEPEVDPNAEYTVTLSGGYDITFADGTDTAVVHADDTFPAVTNNEGRAIAGWISSSGTKYAASGFTLPARDLTLTPYFAAEDDYTQLFIGTAQSGSKPNELTDLELNNFTANGSGSGWGTTLETAKIIVNGGAGGYPEEGVLINYSGSVSAGAAFRMNTSLTSTDATAGAPGGIVAGTHTFAYNFENKGTQDVTFILYMINGGTDITKDVTDNVVWVTVKAGEAVTVKLSPTYAATNDNALSYFKILSDNLDGLKLAVSMSVQYNHTDEASAVYALSIGSAEGIAFSDGSTTAYLPEGGLFPVTAIVNSSDASLNGWTYANGTICDIDTFTMPASDVALTPQTTALTKYNVTLKLPDGFTVSENYVTSYVAGREVLLPAASQITNNTGRSIAGWYIVGEGDAATFITADSVTMVEGGITIAPYFAPAEGDGTVLRIAYSSGNPGASDHFETPVYHGRGDTPATSSTVTGGSWTRDDNIVIDGTKGVRLTYSNAMQDKEYFRLNTAYAITSGMTVRYTYTFKNYASTAVTFNAYQILSGMDYSADGVDSARVTLAAGAQQTITLTVTYTADNTNSMVMIWLEGAAEKFDVGITGVAEQIVAYTLTLNVGENNIAFTAGGTTAELEEGGAMPAITNSSGKTITCWQDTLGNTYTAENFKMPAKDLTLSPVFEGETPVEPEKYTLTLQLPTGFTVNSGFKTEYANGEEITPPAADQYTNDTGRTLSGWYVVGANGAAAIISETTPMTEGGITIAPYFAPESGTLLVAGGAGDNGLPEYQGTGTPATGGTAPSGTWTTGTGVMGGTKGVVLAFDGTLPSQAFFRLKTAYAIAAGTKVKYTYTFTNYSTASVAFNVYQVLSSLEISADGVDYEEVTLEAGATATVELTVTYADENSNALTVFTLANGAAAFRLGIAMVAEVQQPDPEATYTLTIGGGSGVTFAEGATAVELKAGAAIPEVTNSTGRAIAGWYDGATKYPVNTDTAFAMPAADVTLTPYFEAATGYTRLWAMNGADDGVPNYNNTSVNGNKGLDTYFTATASSAGWGNTLESAKKVINGSNGLAEEGVVLQYNGSNGNKNVNASDYMRLDTRVINNSSNPTANGAPGTLNAGTHSFSFNFENFGTEDITFTVYQINSGVSTTSTTGDNHKQITLKAGESITVVLTPIFASGNSGGNALTYITIDAALTNGINLGIAMSVMYNVQTA